MSLRRLIPRRLLQEGGLDWLDRAYGLDWAIVVSIWALAWTASFAPIYERDFDLKDPLISHPHREDTVSASFNFIFSTWLPVILVAIVGLLRKSLIDIHHGILALLAGRYAKREFFIAWQFPLTPEYVILSGLSHLVTVLGKHLVGRLRPDFLARCKWDHVMRECMGKVDSIMSGRKSFPSGHSSTAFSGMTFISLYLAGKTAAWCFSVSHPPRTLRSSRMANFGLSLVPLLWATFVAISRVQDYRHHKEDVIVGSLIGIVSASICYCMFWPSPLSVGTDCTGMPRDLYTQLENRSRIDFQLTHMHPEDEREEV